MTREEMTKAMIEAYRDGVATIETIKYKNVHISIFGADENVALSLYGSGNFDKDVDKRFMTTAKSVCDACNLVDKAYDVQKKLNEFVKENEERIAKMREEIINGE